MSSSATTLPSDRSVPDAGHALPTNAIVDETVKLSHEHSPATSAVATKEAKAPSSSSTALTDGGLITPGQELPGAFPGGYSSPSSPPATTIYQDVQSGLTKLGEAAYGVVPASLVDKFSSHTISDKPITTTTNTTSHASVDTQAASSTPVDPTATGPSAIIPTDDHKTDNKSLASSEIPSASDVTSLAAGALASVQHFFGLGGGAAASTTKSPASDASADPSSASRGGLAGVHADEIASAARDSSATSAHAASAPTPSSSSSTPSAATGTTSYPVHSPKDGTNDPLAGSGGLAALHAGEVALAAKKMDLSHSGEKADQVMHDEEARYAHAGEEKKERTGEVEGAKKALVEGEKRTAGAPLGVDLGAPFAAGTALKGIETSSSSDIAPKSSSSTIEPNAISNSPLAGSGGLAAVHADEIASAARHSSATSAGSPSSSSPTATAAATSTTTPSTTTSPAAAVGATSPKVGGTTGLEKTSSSATSTPSEKSSTTPSGHAKKASLSQKIKGEMKIISGKLGHDVKKVEEGQRLKAGEE